MSHISLMQSSLLEDNKEDGLKGSLIYYVYFLHIFYFIYFLYFVNFLFPPRQASLSEDDLNYIARTTAINREQVEVSREQEVGSREQGAGSREQGATFT